MIFSSSQHQFILRSTWLHSGLIWVRFDLSLEHLSTARVLWPILQCGDRSNDIMSVSDPSEMTFFSDPVIPGVPIYGSESLSLTTPCWDLTDVTLADEDTNLILTDDANRAFTGNVAMQMTQPGGQFCNQCKWRHLKTKFLTNLQQIRKCIFEWNTNLIVRNNIARSTTDPGYWVNSFKWSFGLNWICTNSIYSCRESSSFRFNTLGCAYDNVLITSSVPASPNCKDSFMFLTRHAKFNQHHAVSDIGSLPSGFVSSDRSSYGDDVLLYIYYIRPLFSDFCSVHRCNWCYKSHSKLL